MLEMVKCCHGVGGVQDIETGEAMGKSESTDPFSIVPSSRKPLYASYEG